MPGLDPERRAKVLAVQQELGQTDPEVLSLDIDDKETAIGLLFMAALLKGASVAATAVRSDGETEVITMAPSPTQGKGELEALVTFTSTDGTLSPGAAELAASAMTANLDDEVRYLLG